ncbi:hypothetical protein [Dysgonomonas sp. 25]|uniref:hypothetical protein n=1 Tax=Dysgonomonas sp. 25 TaxID=2302933 RepID=UPI0013D1DF42|nr:hypothetical protein [Dysgonomonas sp. 25]NDV68085.1 hypothetical protein [Dysgonomonas sp. 25]
MKNRIIILVFVMTLFGAAFGGSSIMASEGGELPSTSYLEAEKQSFLLQNNTERSTAPMSMHFEAFGLRSSWGDYDNLFGEDWLMGGEHVGAPIGEVTPIVVALILILYFIYRSVSISKRKNF